MSLQEPYLPVGFDQFWQGVVAECEDASLDFQRTPQKEVQREGFVIDSLMFRGVQGESLYGWIAAPLESGNSPAFQWIAPYGRWSMLPNEYGTREGMISLCFNLHGESAFHEESYKPERGYFTEGIKSKESWIFKRMFQNCYIAQRILAALPENRWSPFGYGSEPRWRVRDLVRCALPIGEVCCCGPAVWCSETQSV